MPCSAAASSSLVEYSGGKARCSKGTVEQRLVRSGNGYVWCRAVSKVTRCGGVLQRHGEARCGGTIVKAGCSSVTRIGAKAGQGSVADCRVRAVRGRAAYSRVKVR